MSFTVTGVVCFFCFFFFFFFFFFLEGGGVWGRSPTYSNLEPTYVNIYLYKDLVISLVFTCDFQQCDILTSIDSDKHVQPPYRLRSSK